ncbi:ubiquitin-conjugating enzyme/RWD-like protein [Lasiosphaeria miniovina]|uniref:Ubiquitin-conjugating enzyme/RWD-like protein n=1 Tax=Lasiosphaeria miniovina TaxID=1954250 RepID=A0AA40AUL7_9PEZI|nr:ubiquitin-conjugating enzyme/RWD-like protein [Lasiosphaeria miniovina]KAK0722258.1 ubiquitin-conjugating enzyme/RWD-like protein [Lasiosphaeria miniovina]
MASQGASKMGNLPAVKRQHLLAEFAGLKQACPNSVYVSLTPGDPSLWSGVIFVRRGPYVTAILRFQISFPDTYPSLPPLVTFSTDIFHPLIAPLTTYMYTTDIQDNGTVSATDEERLPPGGFSLRHGFPEWFGRGRRSRQVSAQRPTTPLHTPPRPTAGSRLQPSSVTSTPTSAASSSLAGLTPAFMQTRPRDVSTYDVLRYIRSAFDDEEVLDSIPLEAAGNPGAWHAWRAHRRRTGKALPPAPGEDGDSASTSSPPSSVVGGGGGVGATARRPAAWNWEGVWLERSKRGIAGSLSEAVLYGNAGTADELINFLNMDDTDVDGIKKNLLRTLGATS